MKLVMAAATDVGTVREANEDFFYYSRGNHLMIVCDGMGGHQSGAVASRIAGKTMRDVYFHTDFAELARLGEDVMDRLPPLALRLVVGARLANHRLRKMAEHDRQLRGMGTTLVALAFGENSACVVHVGDSRLYCLRQNELSLITEDHSLVNELLQDRDISQSEAKNFRKKNVLTRAVGAQPTVKVDVQWFPVQAGDVFLLSSDGLHNPLENQEIKKILLESRHDLQKMADTLVQSAKSINGSDNITAAVVHVVEVSSTAAAKGKEVALTVAEEPPKTQTFEEKFIREKYPQAKSRGRFGLITLKRQLWPITAMVGGILVLALAYWGIKRSEIFALWSQSNENTALFVSKDTAPGDASAEKDGHAVKPVDGHFLFLQVNDSRNVERLRNLSGVRLLDQFSPESFSEFSREKTGQLNRPLVAGSYSLVLIDSTQHVVYRKSGIRMQTIKANPDTAKAPVRTATTSAAASPQTQALVNANNAPVNRLATPEPPPTQAAAEVRQQSLSNEPQSKRGGQIYLSGLRNPEDQENEIYANDISIGKVKTFAEAGFWLSSGTYRLVVKDSTGQILYEKRNVVVENGNVKLIELNKPQ